LVDADAGLWAEVGVDYPAIVRRNFVNAEIVEVGAITKDCIVFLVQCEGLKKKKYKLS
jgi:hypothetical protein